MARPYEGTSFPSPEKSSAMPGERKNRLEKSSALPIFSSALPILSLALPIFSSVRLIFSSALPEKCFSRPLNRTRLLFVGRDCAPNSFGDAK